MPFQSLPASRSQVAPLTDRIPAAMAAPAAKGLSSQHLLNGRREVLIRHGESIYRLRHTSNDKLILTK